MSLNLSNSPLAGGGGYRLVYHSSEAADTSGNRITISVADIGNPFVIYFTFRTMPTGFRYNTEFVFSYLECDGVIINDFAGTTYSNICAKRPDLFHEYTTTSDGSTYYGYIAIPVNNSITYTNRNSNINYVICVYAE